MTKNGGFLVALAAATGLHVGVLGLVPLPDGGDSAGGGGTQQLSIAVAGDTLSTLVERWETAPSPTSDVAQLELPRIETTAIVSPSGETSIRTASVRPLTPMEHSTAPMPETRAESSFAAPAAGSAPALPGSAKLPKLASVASLPTPDQTDQPTVDTTAPTIPDFAVTASLRPPQRAPKAVRTEAAGHGQSATAGTATVDAPRDSVSRQAQATAQAAWAAAIQRKVARAQVYPRGARGDGRVRLAMTITSNGTLAGVQVLRSSGVAAFDKAAVRAARRAAPFPKAPDVLTDARFAFGQWVTFQR